MELDIVDQLLICLADQPRNVSLAMRERGYTQEQISEAWTAARQARFTEATGLGQDRLTPAGRARAESLSKVITSKDRQEKWRSLALRRQRRPIEEA